MMDKRRPSEVGRRRLLVVCSFIFDVLEMINNTSGMLFVQRLILDTFFVFIWLPDIL